jgi:hypothetical protein
MEEVTVSIKQATAVLAVTLAVLVCAEGGETNIVAITNGIVRVGQPGTNCLDNLVFINTQGQQIALTGATQQVQERIKYLARSVNPVAISPPVPSRAFLGTMAAGVNVTPMDPNQGDVILSDMGSECVSSNVLDALVMCDVTNIFLLEWCAITARLLDAEFGMTSTGGAVFGSSGVWPTAGQAEVVIRLAN